MKTEAILQEVSKTDRALALALEEKDRRMRELSTLKYKLKHDGELSAAEYDRYEWLLDELSNYDDV